MLIEAVILAAGRSRRMEGGTAKVLMPFGRGTVLSRLCGTIAQSRVYRAVIVTGFQHEIVTEHVESDISPLFRDGGKELVIARNSRYEDGMAVSFRVGAGFLSSPENPILLFLGDQPLVTVATIDRIIGTFEDLHKGRNEPLLIHPRYDGKKGHPVLFSGRLQDEIMQLTRDDQVRYLTWKHRERAFVLDVEDEGIGLDIDTPEDLRRLRERGSS